MIYPNKPLYLPSLLGYVYYLTYYTLTTKDNIFYPSPSLITPIVVTQLFDVIVYFHNIIRTPNTRSPYPNLFYNFCFSSFFNPAYYLSTNLFD